MKPDAFRMFVFGCLEYRGLFPPSLDLDLQSVDTKEVAGLGHCFIYRGRYNSEDISYKWFCCLKDFPDDKNAIKVRPDDFSRTCLLTVFLFSGF